MEHSGSREYFGNPPQVMNMNIEHEQTAFLLTLHIQTAYSLLYTLACLSLYFGKEYTKQFLQVFITYLMPALTIEAIILPELCAPYL